MPKSLVIVESPTKEKTISIFLGPDFDVKSSYGHIRDLPNRAADIPLEIKKQPACYMYYGFFGVGFLVGTLLMAGGKKGASKPGKEK